MTFLRESQETGARRLTPPWSRRVPVFAARSVSRTAVLAALALWAMHGNCAAQISTPAAPPTAAPFAGAVISEWKGSVQVELPGVAAARPFRGQVLPEGTILDTRDGRLVLVLRSDESEILVQPHTRVVVRAPQPGNWDTLQIMLGKVRAFIRKRTGGEPPFQMGTPSAVIAVRGTRFDVEVNATGISEVDVFNGLVEVGSSTLPGTSVLVSPGMSTRVAIGFPPETPVPTREIRPDVEVPDQLARLEFAREKALQVDRNWDAEFGERPDHEGDENIGEHHGSDSGDH